MSATLFEVLHALGEIVDDRAITLERRLNALSDRIVKLESAITPKAEHGDVSDIWTVKRDLDELQLFLIVRNGKPYQRFTSGDLARYYTAEEAYAAAAVLNDLQDRI